MPQFLKNRVLQVVIAVAAVAIIALGAVALFRPDARTDNPMAVTTPAAPAATSAPASPESENTPGSEASPSDPPPSSGGATCTNFTGNMESPTKFVVERMGVDSPMMVVGKDAQGNPGAPPPNAPYSTAWYNGSPAAGSTQGNVILTIHTYSKGQALGNDLYGKNGLSDGPEDAGLRVGDLIKISDDAGNQVCYRYTGDTKVWVSTYDPTSNVFHNPDGQPQLAIMICWDYVRPDVWDSRIIFYASLIPEGEPV